MEIADQLEGERRARLAAERLLEQKQSELAKANASIAAHARFLSNEVIEKREEAEVLKDQNQQTLTHLDAAKTAMDIAERRLWDSLETVQDGFAVFDRDLKMVAANKSYLVVFDDLECVAPGIRYEDLLQISMEEGVFDTEDLSPADWQRMMLDRWAHDDISSTVVKLWNGNSIKLNDRRTSNGDIVTMALNITDTIAREEELSEARVKAEAATRAKSAFLANMSHEIRTPMNGVIAMADMMSETVLNDEQKLYVDTIKNSGEALLVIINDILDYSKIEADKLTLHSEAFDLEAMIQEVLTLIKSDADGKHLDLNFDYDLFLPTLVAGDRGRVRQILTNLIGNAVKFTSEGGIQVRVIGYPGLQAGQQNVTITVEDSGVGIAEDLLDHIFGEFNQAESEQNRSFDGTGLGLTITKQLVELMGGEIWVNSEVGTGSVFGIRLPLEISDTSAPTAHHNSTWVDRAMLIGPNDRIQTALRKQLHALGIATTACPTIAEAVDEQPTDRDVLFLTTLPADREELEIEVALLGKTDAASLFAVTPHIGETLDFDGLDMGVLKWPLLRSDVLEQLLSVPEQDVLNDRSDFMMTPPSRPPSLRKLRVLAAEDNATNRLVFSKMLKDLNIDLTLVENGEKLVEAFHAQRPDIIFSDISMPVMDGKAAVQAIRETASTADLPIVAMTALAMEGDGEMILEAGFDHYMTKPLKKAALVEHILSVQDAEMEDVLPSQDLAPMPVAIAAGE